MLRLCCMKPGEERYASSCKYWRRSDTSDVMAGCDSIIFSNILKCMFRSLPIKNKNNRKISPPSKDNCIRQLFQQWFLITMTSACECCNTKIIKKKLLTRKLIISSWPTEMTFWHWKWCILGVACPYLMAFVTNIEGSIFIIACREFPSASIHCWPPLYARVWEGWPSPSNAAWMTDRLVFAFCCAVCTAASLFCPLGSGWEKKVHFFMAICIWKILNHHTPSFSPM